MSLPQTNLQQEGLQGIFGKVLSTVTQAPGQVVSIATSSPTASYAMSILYYVVLFAFVIFLVLVIVHFTVFPIFRFKPGDKGIIKVPSATDRWLYWNDTKQPTALQLAPPEGNKGGDYPFINNFTMSIDLLVRRLGQTTQKNRLVLIKANRNKTSSWLTQEPSDDLSAYMSDKASMIVYFDTNNDLNVSFFVNKNGVRTIESSKPIQNIPLYKPFRLTIVAEERIFTVYLDGKHVFQRAVPSGITVNKDDLNMTGNQAMNNQGFFAPPFWTGAAEQQSIFHQNLMLWHRPIQAVEVREASPALALESQFDVLPEQDDQKCS